MGFFWIGIILGLVALGASRARADGLVVAAGLPAALCMIIGYVQVFGVSP